MKFFDEAIALINYTDEQIVEIELLYESSLEKQELDSRFLIKYKNLLENLRSALDYCAQGLCDKYGKGSNSNTYFPYASMDTTPAQFKKRVEKNIPGLNESRPDLVEFLESMQHFARKGAGWYSQFMHLTNKNKHVHLTPTSKMDFVRLQAGDVTIVAKGITLGEGTKIVTDKGVITGGQKIQPGKAIETTGDLKASADRWIAFNIEGISTHMNALEFIKHSQSALSHVVKILVSA